MTKLKITLKRSTIGCLQKQIDTVAALGLKKIGQYKIHDNNPVIKGMIFRVRHLVEVEEVEG